MSIVIVHPWTPFIQIAIIICFAISMDISGFVCTIHGQFLFRLPQLSFLLYPWTLLEMLALSTDSFYLNCHFYIFCYIHGHCRRCLHHPSQVRSVNNIYDINDDPILQDSSQEPLASSKYDFEDGGVGDLRHL